jgi:outer membrane protein OmpA-like peptidoglycan-associated protein
MLSVPMATVPMAYVPFATIEARYLTGTGGTEVLTGAGTLSYSTQADVLFDFGRTDIRPSAVPALRRIAADIARRSSGHAVTVDGHTDSVGTDAENLALSERRAEAVKTWLSTAGGIDAARIRAHGYGESVPVAPNTTETGADNPTGRTRNRRVVISSPG